MEYIKSNCVKCGKEYSKLLLDSFGRIDFSDVEDSGLCQFCSEAESKTETDSLISDYLSDEKDNVRLCDGMRIRNEFYNATLENFKAETESQKLALELSRKMVAGGLKKLVLMGGNGVGKTHLGCAVLKRLGGKRYSAYELSALYRECYSPKAKKTELEVMKELSDLPCLMIDELGRTKGSEAEQNFMSLLIDELHTKGKSIIVTTNKIRKSDCQYAKQNAANCLNCQRGLCIERFLDNDALSRLSQNAGKVTVTGKDFRRQ